MKNNKLNNDIIQLSGYIYKNDSNKKPNNWKIIAIKENKKTGFYAEVFKNGNEIAIIYKGTDVPSKNSISFNILSDSFQDNFLNNLPMGASKFPIQVNDARELYNEIKSKYSKNKINLGGHSLGGSLAQLIGIETGENTVTYGSYGVGDIINKKDLHYDNITNYGNLNDPIYISNISAQVGNTYIMDNFKANEPNEIYLIKGREINNNLSINKHKIENSEPLENAKLLADKNIYENNIILKGSVSKTSNELSQPLYTREMIGKMTADEYLQNEPMIMEQLKTQGGIPSEKQLNQQNELSGFINQISGNSNIFTREDIKNMSTDEYLKNEKAIDFQRIFGRAESSECERARNMKQSAVLDLLQAHKAVPYVRCTSRHGLFAIRIRFAPSVRKSAGVKV